MLHFNKITIRSWYNIIETRGSPGYSCPVCVQSIQVFWEKKIWLIFTYCPIC